jgi:hypothetical protein
LQPKEVTRSPSLSSKITIEVDLSLYKIGSHGAKELLVTGTGIYKRLGALRAF